MQRTEKEQVVAELADRLRESETLIVADYRGLTNAQFEKLRGALREHGARLQVVKNTLTRRAAEEAGAEALLVLLEGPTAIAFVDSGGDPAAVAKALADTARETQVVSLRGGVLSGRTLTAEDVDQLAKLPPADVVKSQLVGAIIAPLTQLLALVEAPLRDLVGLIDARVEQLEAGGGSAPAADEPPAEEPAAEAAVEEAEETPQAEEAAEGTDDEAAAQAADDTEERDAGDPAEAEASETQEDE